MGQNPSRVKLLSQKLNSLRYIGQSSTLVHHLLEQWNEELYSRLETNFIANISKYIKDICSVATVSSISGG